MLVHASRHVLPHRAPPAALRSLCYHRSPCLPAIVSCARYAPSARTVAGLEGYQALTETELDATERIVAMAGVHPFIKLLEAGADVIIGGRSSDSCVFAAPAIHHGFADDHAYYLGKVLECASFCAEP